MRNIYIFVFSALMGTMLCLLSCADDEGNYDYKEINEIAFDSIKSVYIKYGEPITIKPVFKETIPYEEDGDYTYSWVVKDYRKYAALVWSNLKEWDDFDTKLPSGNYTFYYRVKDNKTGITWISNDFQIYVENDISVGFFILSDVNNVGRLDIVNCSKDSFDLKLNILEKVGTELPSLEKPIGVACTYDNHSPYFNANNTTGENFYMCAILTETGTYKLHPSTFLYEENYNMRSAILMNSALKDDFYIKKVFPSNGASVFLMQDNDNNVYYSCFTAGILPTAKAYLNSLSSGERIDISPIMIHTGSVYNSLMWDVKNQSFLRHSSSNNKYSAYFAESYEKKHEYKGDSLLFKYNKTGKDLVWLHYRSREYGVSGGAPLYCIMKDPTTSEFFFGAFISSGTQRYYRKLSLNDCPELDKAVDFAMTYQLGGVAYDYAAQFLFYRTDSKIYAYSITDNVTSQIYPLAGDNSGYNKISFFRFLRNCSAGGSTNPIRDRLVVCTYNESLPAESCGRMQIFKTDMQTAGLSLYAHNGEELEWTGFGKIIDLDWKSK